MNKPTDPTISESIKQKLHAETALIRWRELQRFFAQGKVLVVADDCNLVQVASYFALDQADSLKPLLASNQVAEPENQQAKDWYERDVEVWSVVVAPFVLVQSYLPDSPIIPNEL